MLLVDNVGQLSYTINALNFCVLCQKHFSTREAFKSHHAKVHLSTKHECEKCDAMFTWECLIRIHTKLHDITPKGMCPFCDRTSMLWHQDRSTSNTEHYCTICSKRFNTKLQLKVHIKSHVKSYPCWRCNKKYQSSAGLATHLQREHHVSYLCEHCKKSFSMKSVWKLHMRTHSKQSQQQIRQHSCVICQERFATKSEYVKHFKTHSVDVVKVIRKGSKKTVSKHIDITQLPPATIQPTKKKRGRPPKKLPDDINNVPMKGVKIKTECIQCGQTFHNERSQKAHRCLAQRNNSKLFSCTECKKDFDKKSSLKQHMTTHSDKRPFTCDVCGVTFKSKGMSWALCVH